MFREMNIVVDPSTWPQGKSVPAGLVNGPHSFNIPLVLLLIGHLTTPPHRGGISLSQYWAYVRYFNAITNLPTLELSKEYEEIDTHQKTILSDDFGIGFSMAFLIEKLNFGAPIDGKYFVQNMIGQMGGQYTGKVKGKRGPGKSPDFIAQDIIGNWHVVECKGTQTSLKESDKQIQTGIKQKKTVEFPPNCRGERLVTGVYISSESSNTTSTLKIVDPKAVNPLIIPSDLLHAAADTIARGHLSTALQLSGFPASSETISAPDGDFPGANKFMKRRDFLRRERVDQKALASQGEINASLAGRETSEFIGREIQFDLPGLRRITEGELSNVKITNSISSALLNRLKDPNPYEFQQSLLTQINLEPEEFKFKLKSEERSASLHHGDVYKSTIELF